MLSVNFNKYVAKTAVYKYFNKSGSLLYVGITSDVSKRNGQHKLNSDWFKCVADISIEWFDDRYLALSAEMHEIINNNPLHNNLRSKDFYDSSSYSKVWDYMLRNMKPFNSIIFMQSIVAKEIGITPQFMSKVVRKLLSKGYIAKDGKQQHNVIYMVNPNYAWNGKADSKEAGNAKYARLLTENKGELK